MWWRSRFCATLDGIAGRDAVIIEWDCHQRYCGTRPGGGHFDYASFPASLFTADVAVGIIVDPVITVYPARERAGKG